MTFLRAAEAVRTEPTIRAIGADLALLDLSGAVCSIVACVWRALAAVVARVCAQARTHVPISARKCLRARVHKRMPMHLASQVMQAADVLERVVRVFGRQPCRA